MLIFFYGEDSYRSSQKIKQIKDKARIADPSGMNISVFDFENLDFSNIKKNIESSPFLAKKRLIIICDLLIKGKKEIKEKIVAYLKKNGIPETSCVIFWECGWPNEKQALFKFLKRKAKSEIFEFLEGAALNHWIEKEISNSGKDIEKSAINLLAGYVGGDLWRMRNEVEKLVLYKDNKNKIITDPDVENLVKAALDENIFNFVDAISGKNKKLALKLLHDQMALGKEEIYLLTMMVYQFRNMLLIHDALEKGVNRFEIAKKLKIHPYVVQKTMRSAGKYSARRLKNIYRELLVADERLKSYGSRSGITLDMLICKVCQ